MKKIAIAAMSLALLTGTVAFAQNTTDTTKSTAKKHKKAKKSTATTDTTAPKK